MKVSFIGGGAWGASLAQVLTDNDHEVLIYDLNKQLVNEINNSHKHLLLNEKLNKNIIATNSLKEALDFTDIYLLAVPIKFMRSVLKDINNKINKPVLFISVSKGLEIDTLKFTSDIINDEIDKEKLKGFVYLSGPSHAEEVILRKVTMLVSVSENEENACFVQELFSNNQYMRVYTSNDLIGAQASAAVKNAIAVISGTAFGIGLGENARAALITRGILEKASIVNILGGKLETVYGLTGIGDLIVTASSTLSRNFKAGVKLGQGLSLDEIYESEKQTIEGIQTIYALANLAKKYKLELPMIEAAHKVLENKLSAKEALDSLLSRPLKKESIER